LKQLFDFNMQNIDNKTEPNQDPRERLLDAAENLFCQRGYEGTSIRDITTEAGCNIAAVNYHFSGKEQLYQEMFRRRLVRNLDAYFRAIERVCSGENPTLEKLLYEFVRPILESARQQDPWSKVLRLMVREALNHRLEMETILREIKSMFLDQMAGAFMQLVPAMDERAARRAVFSLDSLVLHPILFMEYYTYFLPDLSVQEIADQIVRFAAAGIRSCAQGRDGCDT
jgi:AcrR family transcriptional regulator